MTSPAGVQGTGGLPDEAVEAAARALSGYSPEQYVRWRYTSKGQRWHDMAHAALTAAHDALVAAAVDAALAEAVARIEQAWNETPNGGAGVLAASYGFDKSRQVVAALRSELREGGSRG